jgi:hypothetical protein
MDNFNKAIEQKHRKLSSHPVYSKLTDKSTLKMFMETHVFAVWDFMSLLKSLQRQITCVELPWRPSSYPKELVRMINEIVLGEESDLDRNGVANDHFSLYLEAMNEAGADTKKIESFLENFDFSILSPATRNFVSFSINLAIDGKLHEVAAAFLYGREKLIPDMFDGVLKDLQEQSSQYPSLIYYLERHIELDGDEHSILAKKCLDILCDSDEVKIKEALKAGLKSLELREELWDEVLDSVNTKENNTLIH